MREPTNPARAEFYRLAALHALNEARHFRDLSARTSAAIDRAIMRSFARQWRNYTARERAAQA